VSNLVWPQPERLGPVSEGGSDAKSENMQCVADTGDGFSTPQRSFVGNYEAAPTNRRKEKEATGSSNPRRPSSSPMMLPRRGFLRGNIHSKHTTECPTLIWINDHHDASPFPAALVDRGHRRVFPR
jgi:hypothetical protein